MYIFGVYLLWSVFRQFLGVSQMFGATFLQFCITLTKNGLGFILGDFFLQTHLVTLSVAHILHAELSMCVCWLSFLHSVDLKNGFFCPVTKANRDLTIFLVHFLTALTITHRTNQQQ
jgi:hypothetical protein